MQKRKLLIFLGIAILIGLVYFEGPETILGTLSKTNLQILIFGELLLILITLIKGFRLNIIANKFSHIKTVDTFKIFYLGQLINQGIASTVGDVSKMAMLKKFHGFKTTKAISSIVTERMFDFTVIILISILLLVNLPYEFSMVLAILFSSALIAILLAIIFAPERFIRKFKRFKKPYELLEEFRIGVRSLKDKLAAVIILTVSSWLIEGLAMTIIFYALGIEVPFLIVTSIMAISILVGFISMIPGGIGTREASMLLLYSYFGVSGEIVIASALVYRLFIAMNDTGGYLVTEFLGRK